MPIEAATYISDLQPSNPAGSDPVADGDNHLRLLKQVLKTTFPNLNAPVPQTPQQLASYVPIGLVAMWSGAVATIPAGWALCNGQTVARSDGQGQITVPDLRDRFVVGAGAATNPLATGGAAQVNITTSTTGSHSHSGSTDAQGSHSHGGVTHAVPLGVHHLPPHSHTVPYSFVGFGQFTPSGPAITIQAIANPQETSQVGGGALHDHNINPDGVHSHNVATAAAGDHSHTATVATMPPYLALAYICKI